MDDFTETASIIEGYLTIISEVEFIKSSQKLGTRFTSTGIAELILVSLLHHHLIYKNPCRLPGTPVPVGTGFSADGSNFHVTG
jgi:hypothetical protein